MKTKLISIIFLVLAFAMLSCNKENNNSVNDDINFGIIEYEGDYPAPENIEYEENGVIYQIEAIPGQIVISADVDHSIVVNAVNANNGKIVEQYPQFGLYTIEVANGNESAFLAAMGDLNISAELNLVEYPKERYDYFVFDDYADANGVHHGRNISNILSVCQNDAVINEINNVMKLYIYAPFPAPPVPVYATTLNYTNFLLWNKLLTQNMVLVNWSHGYGSIEDWDNATESEKNNFKIGWKKSVARKLDQIIRLKKKNPNIDIVFALAAGNERCPELAQMINDLKSNPQYKKVLEENMIFVSDYSKFGNTSSQYGDFCFIKEHPYYNPESGTTSYASPQALCYINQVIKGTIGEDGKNITAVQALAAVKAAIRENINGELDLDEALEMARIMFGGGYSWEGTSWSFTGLVEFYSGDDDYLGSEEFQCDLSINSISNNDYMIRITPEEYYTPGYFEENFHVWLDGIYFTAEGPYYLLMRPKYYIDFFRTGPTTATANLRASLPDGGGRWNHLTGLLQGVLVDAKNSRDIHKQ